MLEEPDPKGGEFGGFPEETTSDSNAPRRTVGAPTEYADAEEVPSWFANLVMTLSAFPLLVSFLCGGLGFFLTALCCILQILA